MVEGVADARVDQNELGFGAVFFVELHDELFERAVVSVEGFHLAVVAYELGDGHDGVGERVLDGVLLGEEDVVSYFDVFVGVGVFVQGRVAADCFEQHNHAVVQQASPLNEII